VGVCVAVYVFKTVLGRPCDVDVGNYWAGGERCGQCWEATALMLIAAGALRPRPQALRCTRPTPRYLCTLLWGDTSSGSGGRAREQTGPEGERRPRTPEDAAQALLPVKGGAWRCIPSLLLVGRRGGPLKRRAGTGSFVTVTWVDRGFQVTDSVDG
jgi:hypothetical protein